MIKILIADDHNLVRAGFKSILEKEEDFEIVGEADNGADAAKLALDLSPDIVLMDINMKETNGITATSIISKKSSRIKIVALSMYSDISYVNAIIKAGATGYLLKSIDPKELVFAIREVYNGKSYICRDINDKIICDYRNGKNIVEKVELTEKEKIIVRHIAEGKISKEIASLTGYSVRSIEAYRGEVMKKINAKSISDIVIYAIKERIFIVSEEEQKAPD